VSQDYVTDYIVLILKTAVHLPLRHRDAENYYESIFTADSFIEPLTLFIINLYSLIMKMVRIKFKGTENDAIGFLELSKRIRVVCLPEDTYEIPFSALKMIDSLDIPYTVIETEGFDNAIRKIRDTASAKI